eukprot:jgi/Botrbrau1/8728/Bobra.0090s0004.1
MRERGGHVLPSKINWHKGDFESLVPHPRTLFGVHTLVVFFGCTPLLQQLCDMLRERTLAEICVVVVGTEEEAKAACETLKQIRFWPNAGFLVFRVTHPGNWPDGTCPKSQKAEWIIYADWANDEKYYHDVDFPGFRRGWLCTSPPRGTIVRTGWITFWRGYTSESVMDTEWSRTMNLHEGIKKGVVKLVNTQADADKVLDEEVRAYEAWKLEGIKEALDERDISLRKGWEDARKNHRLFPFEVATWDCANIHLDVPVHFGEKPVHDTSFWWAPQRAEGMTAEKLEEINSSLPWGLPAQYRVD